MKKINDRILLGIISGLIGNFVKEIIGETLIKKNFGKKDGIVVGAGIFLPKYKFFGKPSKKTKLIGIIADNLISAFLGVSGVYLLSLTGNDHHRIKGIATGHFAWTAMYGVLSRMGATSTYPLSENDNLNGFINHTIFGLVSSEVAVRLGDPSLFKPKYKSLGNSESLNNQGNILNMNSDKEIPVIPQIIH